MNIKSVIPKGEYGRSIRPRIAISNPGWDHYLMSRHMVHYIKVIYPNDYRQILTKILGIRASALMKGELSQDEYRRLRDYYISNHAEAIAQSMAAKPEPRSHYRATYLTDHMVSLVRFAASAIRTSKKDV